MMIFFEGIQTAHDVSRWWWHVASPSADLTLAVTKCAGATVVPTYTVQQSRMHFANQAQGQGQFFCQLAHAQLQGLPVIEHLAPGIDLISFGPGFSRVQLIKQQLLGCCV